MDRKDYIKRYKEIYKNIPDTSQKKAHELIEKVADVLCMMDECKEHLDEEGCVTEMSQGSYSIQRENPWSRVYDSKSKIMIQLLDKLDRLSPDIKTEGVAKAGESLAAFVAKGKQIELR